MSPAPSTVSPTQFADLNELLDELVDGVRDILQADFVGAYLVGSFALGDADEYSDVDFLVVTEREPADEEAVQRLHADLFTRATPWAQHLEGSYAPRDVLRRVDPGRTPFLFLDHGSSTLVHDPHCNTAVVRWTLHNDGVTLAGPDPRTLVEAVGENDLRAEALTTLAEVADWAAGLNEMNRWQQPYVVLTLCRIRYTLASGRVGSKRVAAGWALEHLDAQWHDLIRGALADRPDPVERWFQPSPPELTVRTHAFAEAFR